MKLSPKDEKINLKDTKQSLSDMKVKSKGPQRQWHYLASKKVATFLKGITSNITVIFVFGIAFILLQQKKLESHKKVCENKDFCNIIMPSEYNKTL